MVAAVFGTGRNAVRTLFDKAETTVYTIIDINILIPNLNDEFGGGARKYQRIRVCNKVI